MTTAQATLPEPFTGGEFDAEKQVRLTSNSGGGAEPVTYLVDRKGLLRFSKLARSLLSEDAGEDEAIPLDCAHATPEAVKHLVAWINGHANDVSNISKITYPLPPGELNNCISEWDLQFIHTHCVPEGDMTKHKPLYMLAGLCVYLGVTILQELACGYFAWHIRKAADQSKSEGSKTPTEVVRSWFGLDGDFTEAELEGFKEKFKWCHEVDYNELEQESEDAHKFAEEYVKGSSAGAADDAGAAAAAAPAADSA